MQAIWGIFQCTQCTLWGATTNCCICPSRNRIATKHAQQAIATGSLRGHRNRIEIGHHTIVHHRTTRDPGIPGTACFNGKPLFLSLRRNINRPAVKVGRSSSRWRHHQMIRPYYSRYTSTVFYKVLQKIFEVRDLTRAISGHLFCTKEILTMNSTYVYKFGGLMAAERQTPTLQQAVINISEAHSTDEATNLGRARSNVQHN